MILTCNHCGRRIGRNTEQENHHGCSHCAEFSDAQASDSQPNQPRHDAAVSATKIAYRQTA